VIRRARDGDADAVARLLSEDPIPTGVTGAGVRHWVASQPERARAGAWIAEDEGGIAGWVRARLQWATSAEGIGEVWAFVSPRRRRRGLGSALFETAHEHVRSAGARVVESWSLEAEGGRFLLSRGFAPSREHELLALELAAADLSGLDAAIAAGFAQGYELVPLAAVSDRLEALHALDAAATADVPSTFAEDDIRLDDWLAEAFRHPQLTHEGSFVVLAGGEPVADALVHVDPDARLAANEMTGTHPDHRRRGLARLAKLATIAWAREQGYETILTRCDSDNAGILHLNRSLGYRRVGIETQYLLKELR
jgi:GNAT superfamily N-acetyltransferase